MHPRLISTLSIILLSASACSLVGARSDSPDKDQNTPPNPSTGMDMSSPPSDMNTPPADMTAPTPDMNSPTQDMSTPPVDMAEEDMAAPPVDMAPPPPSITDYEVVEVMGVPSKNPYQFECVEALCPGNKKVLGGGGSWRAGDKVLANTHSFVGQGWVICIAEPGVHEITVQAHCANTTLFIDDATNSTTSGAGEGGCTTVECPEGLEPISGGWVTDVPYAIDTNRNLGDGWNVCGVASAAGTRDARVLCIAEEARVIIREKQSLHQGGGVDCEVAICPSPYTNTGGGGVWPDGIQLTSSYNVRNDWLICGDTMDFVMMTSVAICIQ